MKKALITGGAGFIGSHLAERLLSGGWQVRILDNLSTGSLDNLRDVLGCERLHVEEGSIEDEELLKDIASGVDVIFHMAAAVGVKLIVEEPVNTIETNIRGTENVLKAAALGGKIKVIMASTSEVYGKGAGDRFSEEDDLVFGPTTRSRWSYGCSKAIDEFLALAYHSAQHLPVIIVRLFNTVGPRQVGTYGMVVPRFVSQALTGETISVYGDGKQVRCFTHVRDIINGLCALNDRDEAHGEIFNMGSDRPVTVLELAEKVRGIVNPNVKIEHVPYQQAYGPGFEDILIRVPDLTKLKKVIGFRPTADLDTIIRDVRDYMSAGKQQT